MTEQAGDTALLALVPALDPVVGRFRDRFDPAAAAGVPAHVTVLVPWLPAHRVDDDVTAALTELIAAHPALEVTFARAARFPSVLYLEPEPAAPFAALTRAVAARWPGAPPYGGRFGDDVTPHLTVTLTADDAEQAEVEAALLSLLPVATALTELVMVEFDGRLWRTVQRFALGGSPPPAAAGG